MTTLERKQYLKNYYEQNKERLNASVREKHAERVLCEVCNKKIRKDSVKKHNLTKKHLKNLE